MAEDAPAPAPAPAPTPAPSMTPEELQAEAEMQMRDIGQRFGALPQDKDDLLRLLGDAETWLFRLDQQKTRSSPEILSPTKEVLISRDLLDHPDPDVKLVVTSCLTEVTRLAAPDGPYCNDVMKRIVDTFADLGDINNPSYGRRVSILDTVARVRCCTVMLDLHLDQLILDIFHHLFKSASANHSENVIRCMETILRAVVEESDNIQSDVESCVVQNLTKEAKATHPTSFGLAERLVGFFKDKFKTVSVQSIELNRDVDSPAQDDIHTGITHTSTIRNGGAEQKPGLSSTDDQAIIEQFISESNSKEAVEDATTENPFEDNSKKSKELDPSAVSETSELSKAVKDGENLASDMLCLEIDNKELLKTGKQAAGTTPVAIKKRGRPPAKKSQGNNPVRTTQKTSLNSGKVDPASDSGGRVTRQKTKEDNKSSLMNATEGDFEKQHKSDMKLQKEFVFDKGADDTNLKETMSAKKTDKTKGQQEDNRISKRKCLLEAEEAPPSKKNKVLDKNLVGSRIRVWWPDDKMFYNGVVESYIVSSKKHKVLYDDGDVEKLVLANERWEYIDEEQDNFSSQGMKGAKIGTPESDSKNPPKKRGRPKGVHSSSVKLKGKGAEARSRRITGSTAMAKDDGVKANNKDVAGSEDNSLNDEVKSSEAVDGSKTDGHSTKRKFKEKEEDSMEEEKNSC